jgi:hypothetical protein
MEQIAVGLQMTMARLKPIAEAFEIDRTVPDASFALHQQLSGALRH